MTHAERKQHLLAVLQSYAPTAEAQQRCATLADKLEHGLVNEIDGPKLIIAGLAGYLHDGLSYGDWPWSKMP